MATPENPVTEAVTENGELSADIEHIREDVRQLLQEISKYGKKEDIVIVDGKPTINGDIYLVASSLKEFPGNITINGNVHISSCSQMKSIGENLTVNGNMEIGDHTSIKSIGENLIVKGKLDIFFCGRIDRLPQNMRCETLEILTGSSGDKLIKDALRLKKEGKIGVLIIN